MSRAIYFDIQFGSSGDMLVGSLLDLGLEPGRLRSELEKLRLEGWSMQPTIRYGETIQAEPVRADEIRRGDILLYRWERGVRAHRVARIVAQASACAGAAPVFIVRGDAGGDDEA